MTQYYINSEVWKIGTRDSFSRLDETAAILQKPLIRICSRAVGTNSKKTLANSMWNLRGSGIQPQITTNDLNELKINSPSIIPTEAS